MASRLRSRLSASTVGRGLKGITAGGHEEDVPVIVEAANGRDWLDPIEWASAAANGPDRLSPIRLAAMAGLVTAAFAASMAEGRTLILVLVASVGIGTTMAVIDWASKEANRGVWIMVAPEAVQKGIDRTEASPFDVEAEERWVASEYRAMRDNRRRREGLGLGPSLHDRGTLDELERRRRARGDFFDD